MEAITQSERLNESWFSGMRSVLENTFINIDHKANAEIILHELKQVDINQEEMVTFIKKLPEHEWESKFLLEKLNEMNDLLGFSEDFIKKYAVNELNKQDLNEVKWEILKKTTMSYAKFSKEFYDSLKYAQSKNMSESRYKLMIELMKALDVIYDSSKELVDRYFQKKYHPSSYKRYMNTRFGIEHLLLRVFYVLLNSDNEKKIDSFRKVLAAERVEYTIHQLR